VIRQVGLGSRNNERAWLRTSPHRVQIGPTQWLSFRDPSLVLQADSIDAVRRTIVDVEQLTRDRGLHAVGYVSYEAAGAFGLAVRETGEQLPLAWFALYDKAHVTPTGTPESTGAYTLGPLVPSVDRDGFDAAFGRIKEHLAAGDTYQANYTFRMEGTFEGDPEALFADLVASQRGHYSAFLDIGDHAICSASPELFFEFQGIDVLARPMKGTARRGRTLEEDRALGESLAASPKERAENVMVVDMIRNDLGRVADRRHGRGFRAVHRGALPERLADDIPRQGEVSRAPRRDLRSTASLGIRDRERQRSERWNCWPPWKAAREAFTPARSDTFPPTAWPASTWPFEPRSSTGGASC
jgi:anthranilate/para-aminobenzoate synthase component I